MVVADDASPLSLESCLPAANRARGRCGQRLPCFQSALGLRALDPGSPYVVIASVATSFPSPLRHYSAVHAWRSWLDVAKCVFGCGFSERSKSSVCQHVALTAKRGDVGSLVVVGIPVLVVPVDSWRGALVALAERHVSASHSGLLWAYVVSFEAVVTCSLSLARVVRCSFGHGSDCVAMCGRSRVNPSGRRPSLLLMRESPFPSPM